jgi:protein-L-isoaspartate(D-aspartate) O-methyltransferase
MNQRYPLLALFITLLLILLLKYRLERPQDLTSFNLTSFNDSLNLTEDSSYAAERMRMIGEDIASRGIVDPKILSVMSKVPRQLFVPEDLMSLAYADNPLPIGFGQTISQPYIVALMTQSIEPKKTDRVLEIGTGSGYQAAVLAELFPEVYTVEIIPELATRANVTLAGLGYRNVYVRNADGYFGWEEHAPYDAIMVTAAVDHVPPHLIEQLAEGGRLILPLGSIRYYQTLTLVTKEKDGELTTQYITGVAFVPLTGKAQEMGA